MKIFFIFVIAFLILSNLFSVNKCFSYKEANQSLLDSIVKQNEILFNDSILLFDLANLTTGHKHDEVLQIFELNNKNVFNVA